VKYRKKPVVIEAIQYTGKNKQEIKDWSGAMSVWDSEAKRDRLFILTLEGDLEISTDDFVIKGVKGEFYPCKPDIFEMTYEAVTD
jgi:hypothetical protein